MLEYERLVRGGIVRALATVMVSQLFGIWSGLGSGVEASGELSEGGKILKKDGLSHSHASERRA